MFSLCWSCKTVSQTNAVNWSIFIWKYTKTSIINVFQFCFGPRCVPLKTGSCFSRLLSSFHPPVDFSFTLKLQFCTTSLWRPTLSQKVSILPQKFKCFQINKNIAADWRLRVTWTGHSDKQTENISHLRTIRTKCLRSDPVTQKKIFSCKMFWYHWCCNEFN